MSLRIEDVFKPPPERKRKRRTPAKDRESAVLRECLRWLHEYGALVCRTSVYDGQVASGYHLKTGIRGWPDITGLLPGGRFIGVECKAKRGRPLDTARGRQSDAQKLSEREILKRNGIYILARCAGDVAKGIADANEDS